LVPSIILFNAKIWKLLILLDGIILVRTANNPRPVELNYPSRGNFVVQSFVFLNLHLTARYSCIVKAPSLIFRFSRTLGVWPLYIFFGPLISLISFQLFLHPDLSSASSTSLIFPSNLSIDCAYSQTPRNRSKNSKKSLTIITDHSVQGVCKKVPLLIEFLINSIKKGIFYVYVNDATCFIRSRYNPKDIRNVLSFIMLSKVTKSVITDRGPVFSGLFLNMYKKRKFD